MIRFLRDCALVVVAYTSVAGELFFPSLMEHLQGRGYDRHDEAAG